MEQANLRQESKPKQKHLRKGSIPGIEQNVKSSNKEGPVEEIGQL